MPESKIGAAELRWIDEPDDAVPRKPSEEFATLPDRTFANTVLKKFKQNVFVPLGLLATTACLAMGLVNMRRGNHAKQQIYMRGRVGFQAFTLAAMTIGVALTGKQRNRTQN